MRGGVEEGPRMWKTVRSGRGGQAARRPAGWIMTTLRGSRQRDENYQCRISANFFPLLPQPMTPHSTGSAPDWPLCLDIWSLGVVVWEMLSRRRPFEGLPQTAVQARWLARQVDARLPEVPPPGPGTAPEVAAVLTGLARLSRDCMALRLERRPQIGEVLRRVQELRACLPAGAGALV